jgi:hypothetical protein
MDNFITANNETAIKPGDFLMEPPVQYPGRENHGICGKQPQVYCW